MWPRFRPVSPPCHLGSIEAPGAGPHSGVMSMLAAALAVTIRVYDLYGLPADTRQEALAVAAEALAHAGVEAIIVDCGARPAVAACKLGLGDGELILRIHRLPKDGAHTLGDAIVRGENGPSTIATVYATAIAERARRTGGNLATIVGLVSAHELGHLLLGSNVHASHGLMRPSWDLQRVERGDWDFTVEDAATIRSRLQRRNAAGLLARATP
jgi:hypothetical protein